MASRRIQLFPSNVVPFGMEAFRNGRLDLFLKAAGAPREDGGVEPRLPRMRRGERPARRLEREGSRYWRPRGQ
jgi:hypothetical protein